MNPKTLKNFIYKVDPVTKKKYVYFPAVIAVIVVVVMISSLSAAAVLNVATVKSSQSAYEINTSGNTDFTNAPTLNASNVPSTESGLIYKESSTSTGTQIAVLAGPASKGVTVTTGDFAERLDFTSISAPNLGQVNFTVYDSYTSTSGTTVNGEFNATVDITSSTNTLIVYIYIDFGTTIPVNVNYISVIVDGA
ncbi:hypothetical protein ACNF42_06820 [Cuniculiplasma sp. SKW3]|uniref:hypothetical protein n=1 Tax=Cuniculiplasma sp. SKW3 TaxID=3400170 RepID=UPI003FD1149F